jgi:hypothetical protein
MRAISGGSILGGYVVLRHQVETTVREAGYCIAEVQEIPLTTIRLDINNDRLFNKRATGFSYQSS